jgi:uroporphyrin-III C-methyltransferase/precorrin-2 dehydrogenase/sirohydrochlorin ferrochelatase
MKLYPLFANLTDRSVLVVGGGEVAARKCEALLGTGARVRVGAPALNERLGEWARAGRITHLQGAYQSNWLDETWLVIAATDDAAVNHRVADDAAARRILINVVDNSTLSSFHVPAVIDRTPVQWRFRPAAVRRCSPAGSASASNSFSIMRSAPSPRCSKSRAGRFAFVTVILARAGAFYDRVLGGPIWNLLRAGQAAAAETELRSSLRRPEHAQAGHVALVGAGPGDPGLLTLRALRVLNEADVILHDRLASTEVLDLARRDAQRIEVGKEAAITMRHRSRSMPCCCSMRGRDTALSGSRVAIRSCSGVAARTRIPAQSRHCL